MTKVAAFDVDGVVVDLSKDWWDYLQNYTSQYIPFEEVSKSYDFASHYTDICPNVAHAFWKSRNLYDNATPIPGVVEAVKAFKDAGYHIVFVSHIEGDHEKSKFDFLNKHFPFMDGYVASREKGYVQATIAFDDRLEHLAHYEKINPDCITVWVDNGHDQPENVEGYRPCVAMDQEVWEEKFRIISILNFTDRKYRNVNNRDVK